MIRTPISTFARTALGAAVLTASLQASFFNGTEKLGPVVGLTVAQGSDMVIAGVGMKDKFEGSINITVPSGVTIKQVLAYWEGQALSETEQGSSDGILLNGMPVTGSRVGGATNFFFSRWTSTYRADVTKLGLVKLGANVVKVRGLDFKGISNGAGLVVIYDDGVNTGTIDIRDGNDNAYHKFIDPLDRTEPVVFNFPASSASRTAKLNHFFGSVALERPSVIEVKVGGNTITVNDALGNGDGLEWDSFSHSVTIPAGATSMSVQVHSKDSGLGRYKGKDPASLTWCFCGMSLPPAQGPREGCTPGFWKNHCYLWNGDGRYEVTRLAKTHTKWNAFFRVTPAQSGVSNSATFYDVIRQGGGGLIALNRHTAAAWLNAESPIQYTFTMAQVYQIYRDAVGAISGPETIKTAHAKFELANELGCKSLGHKGGQLKKTCSTNNNTTSCNSPRRRCKPRSRSRRCR